MIILVSGFPGSGKSYFAERFAARLGASYLNSDRIRKEMSAAGLYSFRDRLLVYKEMLRQTALVATSGKSVVVDATFYNHIIREMFINVAKAQSLQLFIIEVVADEDLIKERLKKPRKFSEADFSTYEVVRDQFEEITMHILF